MANQNLRGGAPVLFHSVKYVRDDPDPMQRNVWKSGMRPLERSGGDKGAHKGLMELRTCDSAVKLLLESGRVPTRERADDRALVPDWPHMGLAVIPTDVDQVFERVEFRGGEEAQLRWTEEDVTQGRHVVALKEGLKKAKQK
jgi:hypothetical protein